MHLGILGAVSALCARIRNAVQVELSSALIHPRRDRRRKRNFRRMEPLLPIYGMNW
jgi:hypothetical protein